MDLKKLCKRLLFPNIAIMILLIPTATALLVLSMVFTGTESAISYISYVLAAYTLTVWCLKLPSIISFCKAFKNENKYARMIRNDARLRVNISLYGALFGNIAYGALHLWLGYYHSTFWFYSLGAYYICLAFMRFILLLHTRKHAPGERMHTELKMYRACGWIFLVMNIALALIVFFMLYWNRSFTHHMIIAIAIAAYTFTAFTVAIINVVRYKKYNSPAFSASKAINFASACVSMLTLTSTLLTTFSDGTMSEFEQKIILGSVGVAVLAVVVLTAIYMIVQGTKKLEKHIAEVQNGKQQM